MVQFFHKTKAEMTGDAHTMGAGAKVLVKGLVGGTFGSAAKITGTYVLAFYTIFRSPWNAGFYAIFGGGAAVRPALSISFHS